MKNEDFLDELFEKARNEKDFIPPGDILQKSLEGGKPSLMKGLKANLGKVALGFIALLALLTVTFQLVLKDDKNVQDQIAANSNREENADLEKPDSTPGNTRDLTQIDSGSHKSSSLDPSADSIYNAQVRTSGTGKYTHWKGAYAGHTKKPVSLSGDIDKLMRIQQLPLQEYDVDCRKDTILVAEQGTKFHIESYTFRNGRNQVIRGTVTVQIKECYTPYSFVRENLSTCADSNKLLETGGMYYVNVMQDSDTLSIRKGFEIGITPNYAVPERMDLYYGKRDSAGTMQWEVDPMGKREAPLFICTGGKYARIMNSYFHKNYKLDKADMIRLIDSQWNGHFTSDQRKVLGSTNCSMRDGLVRSACEEFANISHEMALSDTFNVNSRITSFSFECMSKNKYAYYARSLSFDTFRRYVPESDYRNIEIPLFFSINTGWLNMDHMPAINIKYKKFNTVPKNDVVINIPARMKVNGMLYLPEQNSMARAVNSESGEISFREIPKDQKAVLILTSLRNDTFYVFRKEIDTDDFRDTEVKFERIAELDLYLAWLEKAAAMQPAEIALVEEP